MYKQQLISLMIILAASMSTTGFAADREPGLLFYLSGEHGLVADFAAGGDPAPNFANDQVKVLPGGAKGSYLQCGDRQVLSYWAPGNIYAQRGTLSFFWRSREPVGKTEFPVFRVGYGDHSSWDMVWLRIDYNGKPGFDAFVTDLNLGRTRVSYAMPAFPKPDEWAHIALSWDETRGIRFYINGKMIAEKTATGIFDAALDQFGPHSRIISPMQVQSAYNFTRGGDIDEIRIYDRMLSDGNIASLARGGSPQDIQPVARDLAAESWRREWLLRYGWNRPGDAPPLLDSPFTAIRKIEIRDVYDLKRWWWKATDGIRETTWPGVYNRSRLVGRNDYFQLPDWDCYSLSGKSVTFFMPDEFWNHLEISGGARGAMALIQSGPGERKLFDRPEGQEKTFHRLQRAGRGGKIRFTNVEQEAPIGELSAYYVRPGTEPAGIAQLKYRLTGSAEPDNPSLKPLLDYIFGRYPQDERTTMVALPGSAPANTRRAAQSGLPLVHILIPCDFRGTGGYSERGLYSYTWENMAAGLDGIALDLPGLKVKPADGGLIPLNIQVKDPIWPMRTMFDFSFSVRPGEAHTLWLDTRDRILPNGRSLWLTIASAGADFGPSALEGAVVRLIFKPWKEAAKEHELDRFTQARDSYAQLVEEHPNNRRFRLFARFEGDLVDLLRVNPDHYPGRTFWYDVNREQAKPAFTQPAAPAGVPLWAFRQVTNLRYLKNLVNWYIDNRQIENGEFGGGLSDDGDLTNLWPGAALMGATPGKIRRSLLKELDAFYDQGMFTRGLPTIQTDELHSCEEGIQALGQAMMLDFGSPKQIERAMETARGLQWLTGINSAGHRHVRSSYFSGEKMSEEGVWEWSKPSSYLIFQPVLELVQFNGSPAARKMMLELADGLLAHRKPGRDGKPDIYSTINFRTDEDIDTGISRTWPVIWAAYRWTGDRKYLEPILDAGAPMWKLLTANALDLLSLRDTWGKSILETTAPDSPDAAALHLAWQMSGDLRYLERLYARQIEAAALRWYINTEGSLWIDRVTAEHVELQRARLGGVALVRNSVYPGHVVSWKFGAPATDESVAILVPESTPERVKINAYNLERTAVKALLTGWDVEPGRWEIRQGGAGAARAVDFGRDTDLEITFAPRVETAVEMRLVARGVPYWSRPDLGITEEDIRVEGRRVTVTVHSIGAADVPASRVVLRDSGGRVLAAGAVPPLKAPDDLVPKTAAVALTLPAGAAWKNGSVTVEMAGNVPEVTLKNNRVVYGY